MTQHEVFGPYVDPRSFEDDTPYTNERYRSWVASTGRSPHLKSFIPTHIKHMIIRLRCTSFPLAVQWGRQNNIPRSQRVCRACRVEGVHGYVEDDKHFLLECPMYDSTRARYPSIFHEHSTPQTVLNHEDQALLGQALRLMFQQRNTMR